MVLVSTPRQQQGAHPTCMPWGKLGPSEEVGQRSINQSWEILGEVQPGAEGEAFLGNLVNHLATR